MYAPILVHESDSNWPSNMVGFDAGRSYGSPSYWVVHMFANNLGAQVIGASLTGAGALEHVVTKTTGQIQSARLSFLGVSRIDGTGTKKLCCRETRRPATPSTSRV